jgi:hypothetical protein
VFIVISLGLTAADEGLPFDGLASDAITAVQQALDVAAPVDCGWGCEPQQERFVVVEFINLSP